MTTPIRALHAALLLTAAATTAQAQVHTMGFDFMPEGPLSASTADGTTYTEDGITVQDLDLYTAGGPGQQLAIERWVPLFGFPNYSPPNVLDFGTVLPGNAVTFDSFGSLRIVPPTDSDRIDVRFYVQLDGSANNTLMLSARLGPTLVGSDLYVIPSGTGIAEVTLSVSGVTFDSATLSSAGSNDFGRTRAVVDEIETRSAPAGIQFCYGDGSGAACPCDNYTLLTGGCTNSSGEGALAYAYGSTSLTDDSLEFGASLMPAGVPALLFSSGSSAAGGAGLPFGDGIRCLSGPFQRLGVEFVQADGRVHWDADQLLSSTGIDAGSSAYFQVWYRDTAGPCGSGFNLSNGYRVDVTN